METPNHSPHIMDAHSQVYFQSIEDVDANQCLMEVESHDSPDINVVGVENPTIGDVAQGNNEDERTSNLGNCSIDDETKFDGEPILGKVFAAQVDAYNLYNSYALSKGFGIRRHWANKSRVTGQITRQQYVCSKEGFKDLKDKRQCGKEPKRRRDTRTGCKAMMEITLSKSGEWVVVKFFDVHNHVLNRTPSKVIKHHSHRKFLRTMTCKALISELNQKGLRPSQISRAVNVISCGEEVGITPKQCSSYLSVERKNNVGQECYGIIKYFQEKAVSDDSHYFSIDLATNGSLRSVFWADGRSRASYSQFGDVVVFDMTYKTNKLKMPFAPFIGVNHHRQSILFGAALLEDETETTFVWLFEQFLKCMFHRPPIAIITDEDGAMCNAIKKVFPNARHRFCMWHIKKHVIKHLQPYRSRYNEFNESYTKWVKSETIAEFESGWETLKEKYEIENKSWLTNMYNQRQHWVKAYLKDTFFAGMTTSGQSESIHAFFDGYVNSNTMLNDFVVHYEKAIKSRRGAEEEEDFKTMNSKAVLITRHPIEEKAGECYTRNLFEIFKKEWKDSFDCFHDTLSKEDRVTKYSVGLHVHEKCKWKVVEYDSSGDVTATCTCAKFETEGILCKHILYVMRKKKLTTLPEHYILPRWTINARYQVGNAGCGLKGINITPNENGVTPLTFWSVRAKFSKVIEDARNSPSDIKKLDAWLGNFLDEFALKKKANQIVGDEMLSQVEAQIGLNTTSNNPNIPRNVDGDEEVPPGTSQLRVRSIDTGSARRGNRDLVSTAITSALASFSETSKRRVDLIEKHTMGSSTSYMGESGCNNGGASESARTQLKECLSALNDIEGIDGVAYTKAAAKLHDDELWREMFLDMPDDRKKDWVLHIWMM